MKGKGLPDPKEKTKLQMFLSSEEFVGEHRQSVEKPKKLHELFKAHKRSVALTLSGYQSLHFQCNESMVKAYLSGAYIMAEIGRYFKGHYMTVSRAVKKYEFQ